MESEQEYQINTTATEDPGTTAGELTSMLEYAITYRLQHEDNALHYYKQYVGYREALTAEFTGRSNLHIPRTYEELDTLRARIIKTIFATRPYVDFIPRPSGYVPDTVDAASYIKTLEEKAQIAGSKVDSQLDNLMPAMYDYITSMLIYPASVASVGWRYETRIVKENQPSPIYGQEWSVDAGVYIDVIKGYANNIVEKEIVVFDDNEMKPIDFFDFWPDPRGTNLDNMRFCFHREWLTKDEIVDYLTFQEKENAGKVYWPDDWDSIAGAGTNLDDGRVARQSVIGLRAETEQGYWKNPSDGYLYEVMHYWTDEKHKLLINRHKVVFDGDNLYTKHGKKPFISSVFEPLPGEFYGMSAVSLLDHLQEELNTTRNQRVDNVSFILNRMWKVRNGADIDESELVSRPSGIIHVDNPDDVTEMDTKMTVGPDSYREEEILKTDMENAVGVPGVVRGASDSNEQTATEVVTKSSSAGMRFDSKIMLFEATAINRLAYMFDCNNQQFCDTTQLMKIYGPLGAEWKQVDPDQLVGEHDYRPAGSSIEPMANKELRRNQLTQLMGTFSQTPNPYVDMYELTRTLLETFDIRNVDSIMKSKEQVEKEMQQQAEMAAQQEQGKKQEQGKPPSTSISFKDLPPDGQEQLAAQAGIQLDPNSLSLFNAQLQQTEEGGGQSSTTYQPQQIPQQLQQSADPQNDSLGNMLAAQGGAVNGGIISG